ncbi:ubiquitin conjugating enzyme E2, putative [Paecilomyces variotii No. 5]|uniref:Ubiquitin conjugating enzyme E2, putative n=1 Tax=Byssochlamys spectabilis (strain No. 5 / NBRC 109023) TaxID=1356009 RepID=V5G8J2_BYSSN|nr:ubiquitin conjugating enzyme E2, putative [Paecilomyces variotii No. 5]
MVSGFRRLAADHAALHNQDLPPNYLFLPANALPSSSDDLTQLTILLAGPQGTPYSQGLWRLHLKVPEDYPKSPPKASFKTRIWHPNVDEVTGSVCVDTLKRDWKPTLTLRDVLITISCLLIYPNPDSALNSAAGALLQEDYETFARQARLMTSIHAPVPADMKDDVIEAKRRGEDAGATIHEDEERHPTGAQKAHTTQKVVMKKRPAKHGNESMQTVEQMRAQTDEQDVNMDVSEDEDIDPASASKENDPSLSPSPVAIVPPSPRKNSQGKRPLSVLATSTDSDMVMVDAGNDELDGMTASERNIAANVPPEDDLYNLSSRKAPKLAELSRGANAQEVTDFVVSDRQQIYDDLNESLRIPRRNSGEGKENYGSTAGPKEKSISTKRAVTGPATPASTSTTPALLHPSKVSKPAAGTRKVSAAGKPKPRVGLRRL